MFVNDTNVEALIQYGKSQTRTSKTETAYRKTVADKASCYQKQTGAALIAPTDVLAFTRWMIDQRSDWTKSTWRSYKAALIFGISNNVFPYSQEAVEQLEATGTDICKGKRQGKTSSMKPKKIPEADLEKLVAHLNGLRSKWAIGTKLWIQVGVITGLRPQEWIGAVLRTETGEEYASPSGGRPMPRVHTTEDGLEEYVLTAKNAKATNGRANGEYRNLRLHLTAAQALLIANQIWFLNAWAKRGDYGKYYTHCRITLWRACRKLFKKGSRYTLYSARHQFAANQKASGKTKEEVSDSMGHANVRVAQQHYGKRRSGWKVTPEAALDQDMAAYDSLDPDNATDFEI